MADTTRKYLNLEQLQNYDSKLKSFIAEKDLAVQTAAGQDATAKANAVQAKLDEEVTRAKEAEAAAQAAADKAQGDVDNLEAYVGTFTASEDVDTVVKYIDAKTANIASDETVSALADRVGQAEADIDAIEKDYLKAADKKEVTDAIAEERARAEGAESGLNNRLAVVEGDYLKKADKESLQGQITENTEAIAVLNGTGAGSVDKKINDAFNDFSTKVSDDSVVNTYKELIDYAATHGAEFTELVGEVDELQGDMSTAKTDISGLKSGVATKAEQADLDALEAEVAKKATTEALTTLEGKVTTNTGDISTLKEKVDTLEKSGYDDTEVRGLISDNADAIDAVEARTDALEADTHTHSNKALLDTYTQTEANLADAVAKKHEHANKAELDKIAVGDKAKWDAAEQNAKTYADGLNTAMASRMSAAEAKVSSNETAISDLSKTHSTDKTALEASIKANTDSISALEESLVPIEASDIEALFA